MLEAKEEINAELEQAKELIDEFCMQEYESPADFSNLSKIGIGFTLSLIHI